MIIETRDFGTMEIDEKEMLVFMDPVFGFEDLTKYVLLSDDETGAGLMWLQSAEKAEVCFILLDPEEFGLDYQPDIPENAAKELEIKEACAIRVIAVVPDNFRKSTVNLKSPIVINLENKKAAQIILEADFPIRMPLFEEEREC